MEGWFVCCLVCGLRFDCGDGDVGGKTKFCPDVAGFCPGLSRNLSRCVLNLSGCGRLLGSVFRTGAAETGVERVNMGGDSGAEVSLVRRVSVLNQVPRARARFRRGYGSAGGDQGRFGQVWGFVCGDLFVGICLWGFVCGDLFGAVGECSGVVCRVAGGRVGPRPTVGVGEMDVDCLVELGPLVACGNPGFHPRPPGGSFIWCRRGVFRGCLSRCGRTRGSAPYGWGWGDECGLFG